MLVAFKWKSKKLDEYAALYVRCDIDNIDTVENRLVAYEKLSTIVGEENVSNCILM